MIDVQALTFSYQKTPVLKGLTFHVNSGEIFGFLGPSGAGKSTLQKLLIGLLPNYGGTATVMGQQCDRLKRSFFSRVGVDFEVPTLYEKLTARENLRFFSSLYARPCFEIDTLLGRLGLEQAANMRVGAFSKGMKSRLNFARAILHNPDLLFLDEPTSGLDPVSRDDLLDVFLELARQGVSILFSTHITSDLDKCADSITYIKNGRVLASEDMAGFVSRYRALVLSEPQLTDAVRSRLIGLKRAKTGYSALIAAGDAEALGLDGKPADLETIMVHMEKP